jgi:hypothetical protein
MRLVQEAGTYLEQVRLAAQAGRLAPEKGQPLISGLQQALAAVQVPAPTHQGRTPDEV